MKLAYKEDPLPKYIAVEGPIGVGKTTLANKLANVNVLLSYDKPFRSSFFVVWQCAALGSCCARRSDLLPN